MGRLQREKLHVHYAAGTAPDGPVEPRRYTLTHSDLTGDLFLTVGPVYDEAQIGGWYTRLMRDEVLAEWRHDPAGPALHVYCHLSGGLVLGPVALRYQIFQRELPLVFEAFWYGDRALLEAYPELEEAPIWVHFATGSRPPLTERWGVLRDYRR